MPATPVVSFKTEHITSDSIRISFGGDLIIHEDLYKKVVADPDHDFSKLWKNIFPLIEKADFSYVNLEGPVALGVDRKKKDHGDIGFVYDKDVYCGTDFLFNYHPSLIDSIKKSGLGLVSTANNHAFDRGSVGIDKTIAVLKEKNLYYVGTRKAGSDDPFYTITPIKNFNIAWIACTEATNAFKDKKSQILLCFEQKDQILDLIKTLSQDKKIDAVIVLPHWGTEYKHIQGKPHIKLAHEFLNQGATAVIGSHPHVLQPIEKYVTDDGRETFIAYSLGNFLAYQRDMDRKASGIVYLDFTKNNSGKTVLTNYFYEPIVRVGKEIWPARKMKDVVKFVETYLGPLANP